MVCNKMKNRIKAELVMEKLNSRPLLCCFELIATKMFYQANFWTAVTEAACCNILVGHSRLEDGFV